MNSVGILEHIKVSPKHTKSKHEIVKWHKLKTVRTRACALQESFYPVTEVRYEAVKTRMASLLGICDRISVLSYLGRPECRTEQKLDHTKKYNSGKVVPITHYLRKELSEQQGYINTFGLGYVYLIQGEWWIHWNHSGLVNEAYHREVNPLNPPKEKDEEVKPSIANLSLTINTQNEVNESSILRDECKPIVERESKKESNQYEREISVFCRSNGKNGLENQRFSRKSVNRNSRGRWVKRSG